MSDPTTQRLAEIEAWHSECSAYVESRGTFMSESVGWLLETVRRLQRERDSLQIELAGEREGAAAVFAERDRLRRALVLLHSEASDPARRFMPSLDCVAIVEAALTQDSREGEK